MEYVITSDLSFEEIEAKTMAVLEQRGFVVQRTFSLLSAIKGTPDSANSGPGYSVIMIHHAGDQYRHVGLITLYERDHRTVLTAMKTYPAEELSWPAAVTANAEKALFFPPGIVSALVAGGLEFCVDKVGSGRCPGHSAAELDRKEDVD